MRDYQHIDKYLDDLAQDIYLQPQEGDMHLVWSAEVLNKWLPQIREGCELFLDVGCGSGFISSIVASSGLSYFGVCLGDDYDFCAKQDYGHRISKQDFSFLNFADNSIDIIYSRHSLEHSPMPILTLMEWYRVSKDYLILVVPTPEMVGFADKNHYSVSEEIQILFWLERVGWNIIETSHTELEFRFLCTKREIEKEEDDEQEVE